jgi:hypothetical protein
MQQPRNLKIEILDRVALDNLLGLIDNAATQPGAAERVEHWRATHGHEHAPWESRSFVVVGKVLMFVHPCPDEVLLPFAAYPDGTVKVYTDAAHAGESFYRDPPSEANTVGFTDSGSTGEA